MFKLIKITRKPPVMKQLSFGCLKYISSINIKKGSTPFDVFQDIDVVIKEILYSHETTPWKVYLHILPFKRNNTIGRQ